MNGYCITIIRTGSGESVFHVHINAPFDAMAVSMAVAQAAEHNLDLVGCRIECIGVIDVSVEILQTYEQTRLEYFPGKLPHSWAAVDLVGGMEAPPASKAHFH